RNRNRELAYARHLELLSPLPDVAEHLAADFAAPGLLPRHHALGRAHDRHTEASEHARDLRAVHVDAEARPRDPADAAEDRLAVVPVGQAQRQVLARAFLLLVEAGDEALVL